MLPQRRHRRNEVSDVSRRGEGTVRRVCLCLFLSSALLNTVRAGRDAPRLPIPLQRNGDALPAPSKIRNPQSAIKIGLLIPQRGSRQAEGEEVRRGAEMASAEANAGARGQRFELVVRPDDGLWGAGSRAIVQLISDKQVCALLGGVSSESAHLIEQIAMKARLVYVTPWASDPTLTQIGIPWMFRCVPDDHQQAKALVQEIFTKKRLQRVGVLIADDRSARLAANAFLRAAEKSGHPIPQHLRWQVMEERSADLLSADSRNGFEQLQALALFAPSALETKVVRIIQQQHKSVAVFSPLSTQYALRNTQLASFRRNFCARYGTPPTPAAAYAYDATRLLIHVVRAVSPTERPPDRAAVRDALLRIKFEGVTGTIQFDRKGNRRVLSTNEKTN